jgi:hypothetical protein
MKYVISSFALSLSLGLFASPIRIFYEVDSTRAGWVKEILIQNYKIPEDLIVLKNIAKCRGIEAKGKLDLCINDNGDLSVVSVDQRFISESLKIFYTP